MTNLVIVTKESRLILKISAIVIAVLLLFYFGIKGGSLVRSIFFPKPPPPPKEAFGKLPHLSFPSLGASSIQFQINTIDGKLPILPDRVNVYKLYHSQPDLLALRTAKNTVNSENFVENQIKLSDNLYQWTQTNTGVIIQYDILTKNFTITSNYLNNTFLASSNLMPQQDTIKQDVMSFLSTINADTKDIDIANSKVTYLQIKNGALVQAENLGSAQYARVTLLQNNVDNIPITYNNPDSSILNFVVSYPGSSFQVVEGEFFNHEPDLTQKTDYPIKTAQQALDDLKNGNAYVINPLNLTSVDITNVEVKYYLNKNSSQYLMPIIVFSGINFTAYVEAIPQTSLSN